MAPDASGSSTQGAGSSSRTSIFVVGLGMVGMAFLESESCSSCSAVASRADAVQLQRAEMLTLDVDGRYFIRSCGEEPHYAYNRVGLTGESIRREEAMRKPMQADFSRRRHLSLLSSCFSQSTFSIGMSRISTCNPQAGMRSSHRTASTTG